MVCNQILIEDVIMKLSTAEKPVIAGIDIGTNTILLTIGYIVDNNTVHILHDEVQFARLGKNVDCTGYIEEERIMAAENILKKYAEICINFDTDVICAVATSAMRDALNGKEVQSRLEHALGAAVTIIEGEEEARLCFLGTVPHKEKAMVIDIGGGSTEIIIGTHEKIEAMYSINIGAVRLTERFFLQLPPTQENISCAIECIHNELSHISIENDYPVYCVAGTPVTLASIALGLESYDSTVLNGYELSALVITIILQQLLHSTRNEILQNQGVVENRADILPAGTLILETLLRKYEKSSCFVSTGGVRVGLIKNYYIHQY